MRIPLNSETSKHVPLAIPKKNRLDEKAFKKGIEVKPVFHSSTAVIIANGFKVQDFSLGFESDSQIGDHPGIRFILSAPSLNAIFTVSNYEIRIWGLKQEKLVCKEILSIDHPSGRPYYFDEISISPGGGLIAGITQDKDGHEPQETYLFLFDPHSGQMRFEPLSGHCGNIIVLSDNTIALHEYCLRGIPFEALRYRSFDWYAKDYGDKERLTDLSIVLYKINFKPHFEVVRIAFWNFEGNPETAFLQEGVLMVKKKERDDRAIIKEEAKQIKLVRLSFDDLTYKKNFFPLRDKDRCLLLQEDKLIIYNYIQNQAEFIYEDACLKNIHHVIILNDMQVLLFGTDAEGCFALKIDLSDLSLMKNVKLMLLDALPAFSEDLIGIVRNFLSGSFAPHCPLKRLPLPLQSEIKSLTNKLECESKAKNLSSGKKELKLEKLMAMKAIPMELEDETQSLETCVRKIKATYPRAGQGLFSRVGGVLKKIHKTAEVIAPIVFTSKCC